MDSMDTTRIERRARMRYEVGRVVRALLGFAPVLLIVAVAAMFARQPSVTLALGLGLFAAGVFFLSYGRSLKRAVLPGLAAGLAPLILALCAVHAPHMCAGNSCMMVCLPVCTVGGLVAGLTIAAVGLRHGGGAAFWLSASAVALLTGAMGCACMGYSGVIALTLGFIAGLIPRLAREFFSRGTT